MSNLATRSWSELLGLYRGSRNDLAADLNLTRQGMYYFVDGHHRKPPWWLCKQLARAFEKRGTTDGSPPPNGEELVRAWTAAFRQPQPTKESNDDNRPTEGRQD